MLGVLGVFALLSTAEAVPVDRIADPRPAHAAIDLTATLAPKDVAAIDAAAARGRSGGELAVAIVDSVDGAAPRAYATSLFNRWALDTTERNRGVLVLLALADHKAEIVVGDGYADTQATTDAIMDEVIVARMKAGGPRAAAEAATGAAEAAVDRLLLGEPASGCAAGCVSCADNAAGLLPLGIFGGVLWVIRRRFRAPCPRCRATARLSRRTVTQATTTSTGQEELTLRCPRCDHTETTLRTLAMVSIATSNHDTGSSGGGSSGGGDSSGGGSSGSW